MVGCGPLVEPEASRDAVGGVELDPVGEDGQPEEHPLLVSVEEAVGPVDRGAHRAVPIDGSAPPAAQQAEAVVERTDDRRQPQRRRPRRRQLEGQGDAVQAPTDVLDHRVDHRVEVGTGRLGPLAEQLDRRRRVERPHRHDVLAVDAQGLAARGDHRQVWAPRREVVDHRGRAVHDVLAVVHHQQGVGPRQHGGHRGQRVGRRPEAHGERDRVGDVVGIGHARQLDEPDARRPWEQIGGGLDASLVLPTPPTPVSVTIGCCRTRSTTRATSRSRPIERRALRGEVVRARVQPAHRREALRQLGVDDLPHPLGLRQITQPVDAQVRELHGVRARARQGGRHVRDEDLTAVARGGDARGPVDRPTPEVVARLAPPRRCGLPSAPRGRWSASPAARRSPPGWRRPPT